MRVHIRTMTLGRTDVRTCTSNESNGVKNPPIPLYLSSLFSIRSRLYARVSLLSPFAENTHCSGGTNALALALALAHAHARGEVWRRKEESCARTIAMALARRRDNRKLDSVATNFVESRIRSERLDGSTIFCGFLLCTRALRSFTI